MAFVVRKPGDAVADIPSGKSVVLYGPPLVGKTSTLQNDPTFRICLIDFDKNSGVVEESENVTIIGCDTFDEYLQVKDGVDKGVFRYPGGELSMDFDAYAIDSFTTFEEKIKAYVAAVYAPNRSREIAGKFGVKTDWQDLQDREIQEVRDWQAMTRRKVNPINVIWIGHDMYATNEMGQAIATQLMLQGKYAAPRIGSAVDAMFYMVKVEKDKQIHRGIYTLDSGIIKADARMAIQRRGELPPFIWNPKWGEIFDIMAGIEN